MLWRKLFFYACVLLATACLTTGLWLAGWWGLGLPALLLSAGWVWSLRTSVDWPATATLMLTVVLAAAGLLVGAAPYAMLAAAAAALAAWDGAHVNRRLQHSPEQAARVFGRRHFETLAAVLAAAVLLTGVGRQVQIETPFLIVLALALLVLWGIDRIWGIVRRINE